MTPGCTTLVLSTAMAIAVIGATRVENATAASLVPLGSATASTCDKAFSFSLPAGTARDGVTLGSTASLTIRDGVSLKEPTAGWARSTSVGSAVLVVGADSRLGDITSVGGVVLRDRARVDGSVRTSGSFVRGNGVVVTGAISPGAVLLPADVTRWTVCVPSSTRDVNLEPDASLALAPGSYGTLVVNSRAQLSLTSGLYTFRSLRIEPEGKLLLDKENGPIALYVSDAVTLRGMLMDKGGNPDDFFVGYAGTDPLFLGGAFRGTIVAPAARLVLTTVPAGHVGTFFAQDIDVEARVTITHRPFPSWDVITHLPGAKASPSPPPSQTLAGRVLHRPPPLSSPADVPAFIDWASFSVVDEREDARAVIQAAAKRDEVAAALGEHFRSMEPVDHARALVTLSVLGEMRNPVGEAFLTSYIHEALPATEGEGSAIGGEGEDARVTAKATLQAKAVTGLAYRATRSALEEVMWAVGKHPSRIVRAEAIAAFMAWYPDESGGAPVARKMLLDAVRPEERAFLDRVRRIPGEPAETFNARLASFLQLHPDLVPPPPVKAAKPPVEAPPPGHLRRIPIF